MEFKKNKTNKQTKKILHRAPKTFVLIKKKNKKKLIDLISKDMFFWILNFFNR